MIKKLTSLLAIFSFIFVVLTPAYAGAEDVFKDVCSNPEASTSTVCKSKNLGGKNPIYGPDGILTAVINIVSLIVGIVAVIFIIIGGLKMITSGSNPQDVAKARETVIYAIVGVIIALLAQVIVQFVLKKVN